MTFFSRRALVLTAAFAAAGCFIQKPQSVPAPPPSIERFTADATSVRAGEAVQLSWKVSNATSISLIEVTRGALAVPVDTFEGTHDEVLDEGARFVLTAQGPGGTDARAVAVTIDGEAGALSFAVSPAVIAGGERTTVSWQAPGARTVTLTANGQSVPTGGQLTAGAVTFTPPDDTTFVLTSDVGTAQATVSVQPTVLSFTADLGGVQPGDPVTLSWTTAGARELVLSTEDRGELFVTSDAAELSAGSFTDTVPPDFDGGTLRWSLAARKDDAVHERTAQVAVGVAPAILRFEAPRVVAVGGLCQLRWETQGATSMELRVDGAVVFSSRDPARTALGFHAFPVGDADFAVELVAFSAAGVSATQVATVDTVRAPTLATLQATPFNVSVGQSITLTWTAPEARRVRVVDSFGEAVFSRTGARAEGGSVQVFPWASTQYTLTADNLLGDFVTATANVVVSGSAPAVALDPPTPLSGQQVSVLASEPGAVLHGFPHSQVVNPQEASFIDIKGTGQLALAAGTDVTQLQLPFSSRLWGRSTGGNLTVSRAGWVAFDAPAVVNASRVVLPSTAVNAPPGIIAPFWADLRFGAPGAAVYYEVRGEAPEETLIVQWEKMRWSGSVASEVTLQLRLTQRGALSFHYKTMTTPGTLFTIGAQDTTRTLAVTHSTVPTANSALYFFSPVTAPVDVRMVRGARYGGSVQVGDVFVTIDRPAPAISVPQDLTLTEAMFRTAPAVGLPGQYLELLNQTGAALDLTGWRLTSGAQVFAVPDGLSLPPGAPLVLAASLDLLANDGVTAAAAWGPGFSLPVDGGTVVAGTADAGVNLALPRPTDAGYGLAIEYSDVRVASLTSTSCVSDGSYGSQGQQGTPGVLRGCGRYFQQGIPSAFSSAPQGSVLSLTPTGAAPALNEGSTTVTLPQPFTYWGETFSTLNVSSNGFITFTAPLTTTAYPTNSTTPVGLPNATLAPHWDDLDGTLSSTGGARVAAWQAADRYIVSWEHFGLVPSVSADINAQVHLVFDGGVVEFHYGELSAAVSTNQPRAQGNSATVWLDALDGGQAIPTSINTANLQPNSGFRFSPQ